MYILGISGGVRHGNMDGSATLMEDGKVIAAIEEERIVRIKHAIGLLPGNAIRFVLKKGNISIHDIDYVVFHTNNFLPIKETLSDYFKSKFGHCPNIELVNHHDAHAASAYYASGFERSMVISMDLSGDGISTQLCVGDGGKLTRSKRFYKPNSLGIFYSIITQFCGFVRDNDEYKVMGLSSYGDRNAIDFNWLLNYNTEGYTFDSKYIKVPEKGQPNPSKQEPFYNQYFIDKLGAPRLPDTPISSFYENVAASAQNQLENVVLSLVENFHKETGLRKVCLAGGVALNCVTNQKIMNLEYIDEIFVQPVSSDAGTSLGAAYLMANRLGYDIIPMENVFLGNEFSNNEILKVLKLCNVAFKEIEDVSSYAAKRVAEDKIVGWFQGRMEFGPRALGARSILGNPKNPNMKDIINQKIKFRESFRPMCPSVLKEDTNKFFEGKAKSSPYMTITYNVKEEVKSQIPSVTHVDGTARIQTVEKSQNPLYHTYLERLKEISGIGVSINTSFNLKGQCIVNSPYDALSTFYGSGMDDLIIGNYLIKK